MIGLYLPPGERKENTPSLPLGRIVGFLPLSQEEEREEFSFLPPGRGKFSFSPPGGKNVFLSFSSQGGTARIILCPPEGENDGSSALPRGDIRVVHSFPLGKNVLHRSLQGKNGQSLSLPSGGHVEVYHPSHQGKGMSFIPPSRGGRTSFSSFSPPGGTARIILCPPEGENDGSSALPRGTYELSTLSPWGEECPSSLPPGVRLSFHRPPTGGKDKLFIFSPGAVACRLKNAMKRTAPYTSGAF